MSPTSSPAYSDGSGVRSVTSCRSDSQNALIPHLVALYPPEPTRTVRAATATTIAPSAASASAVASPIPETEDRDRATQTRQH